ncbi:RadC family protein [Henriciella mobilis]|uniref:JAB domain-containing protein n=1 Tax=Henriciella mobilis TaxID=2305467 RepID=A0A399RIP3_9PROT|nr:DNA repair protein RadC [Henriciella mobilis]RIJ16356.1 JAB domain-containing protein [Henriciella mobilis]RIJ22523.1 JAB domain-containing protein [Henriciella mobilis]RIJ29702.1 JAB domain-containing protein [Henriciella mobilis]
MRQVEEAPLLGLDAPQAISAPKPHWQGHRDRLRTRLVERGANALEDYELLETLLFAFIPRRDVKPVAKALLARFGSLSGVLAARPADLTKVAGVGETVAAYLKATAEIGARASRETLKSRPAISSWTALQDYVKRELQHEGREQFRVLFLDRKNQLIADETMGHGTVDHAPVYPREIARRALELQASSLILVHNHPSGDPTPSRADIDMTREVIDALDAFEITVHDHLIAARSGVLSFRAQGLI